jgi:hypothetical protein
MKSTLPLLPSRGCDRTEGSAGHAARDRATRRYAAARRHSDGFTQRIGSYRAARGSDIARANTPASSGLTGRPPAHVREGTARGCITRARRGMTRATTRHHTSHGAASHGPRRCIARATARGPAPGGLRRRALSGSRATAGILSRPFRRDSLGAAVPPSRVRAGRAPKRRRSMRRAENHHTRSDRSGDAGNAPDGPRRP